MKTPKIGRLAKFNLRTACNNGAGDFTPWLAVDENVLIVWMLETVDDRAFRPRINALDAANWTPDVSEELES